MFTTINDYVLIFFITNSIYEKELNKKIGFLSALIIETEKNNLWI